MDDIASKLASPIKILLLDVDGVLSNGKLYFSNSGDEIKSFHIHDGLGIKLLQQSGVDVGIITGRDSHIVKRRAENLGIKTIIQGREDKLTAMNEVMASKGLTLEEVAYMGDDLPDLPAIRKAGLGMTVANGQEIVRQHADWISNLNGGDGAVREACELIMAAQGTLDAAQSQYLK